MPDLRLLLASCFGSRVEGHAPAHKEGKAVDIIGVVTSEPHRCAADFFGLPNPSIGNALEGLGVVIGRIPRPHVDRPSNRPRADAGMTGRERDRLASPRTGTGNQRFLSLKQGRTRQFAITGAGRLWLFCENGIRGGTVRLSRICIFEHGCLRLADRRASRGPFPIRRSCFRFLTKSLRSSGSRRDLPERVAASRGKTASHPRYWKPRSCFIGLAARWRSRTNCQ